MVRHRFVMFGASILCAGVVLGVFVSEHSPERVNAQLEAPGSPEQDRERLYAQLDREAAEFEKHGQLLRSIIRLSAPFVVHIEAKKPSGNGQSSGRERFVEEAGSGIIIEHRSRFYVLTNRHVIKDAARERITIQLDDSRELHPSAVITDPDTDIAVMSVNATDLTAARLGDSDSAEMGDFVLAVGSPFGLSRSVTHGIVSAKGRRDLELGGDDVRYQDFIQTDAAINPGNSGGPLLNMRGAVIGMNTAIASSSGGNEGIGFSIPINMTMIIARQLIDNGSVRRAFLGVNLDSKFNVTMATQLGLPRLQGARITGITPNSPASAAGLQVGDVVLEFDGVAVEDDIHLVNIVSLTQVNKTVPVVVYRDREPVRLNVRVGDRQLFNQRSEVAPPKPEGTPLELSLRNTDIWDLPGLGVSVAELSDDIVKQLQLSRNVRGMLVTDVDPAGPAAGRVRQGEIIDRIGLRPVGNVKEMERVLSLLDNQQALRLHVSSAGASHLAPRTVVVRLQDIPPR